MITLNAKKILIPTDFSEISYRAVEQGIVMAKLFNGEIVLVNVQKKADLFDVILPALNMENSDVITGFVKNQLELMAQKLQREHGVRVSTVVLVGSITSQIIEYAEANNFGLIIMGTQGSDSVGDAVLGTNAYRVITNSNIPVMTVKEEMKDKVFSNILLPIDSSEHSRQKVNSAIQLAEKFNARLHVLGILGKHEPNYEYKLKVILPQIKKLAEKKHVMCSAEIDKATNRAQKTIEYARKVNADLVIIMSDQNEGFSSFVSGSYAYQLINNSHIPVLSIQPELHPEHMEQVVLGGMWQK